MDLREAVQLQRNLRQLTSEFIKEAGDLEVTQPSIVGFKFKVRSIIYQYLLTIIIRNATVPPTLLSWCVNYFASGARLEVEYYLISEEITTIRAEKIIKIVYKIRDELTRELAFLLRLRRTE